MPASNIELGDLDQALSRIHSYNEIRLLVAGTANFGHQASSIDLLLRLVYDFSYTGLITVVYDRGDPGCGINIDKLPRLLRRYVDPNAPSVLPHQMHNARVQWFSIQDFSEAESRLIDFGLTGGAEIGRLYHSSLADMLNVRTALKAQPFQWPWCRDGIDFHSTSNIPPVDLLSRAYLGSSLFHTAYRVPQCLHSPLPTDLRNGNDTFLHQLIDLRGKIAGTSLSCVYGLREDGVSHVDPANLLYIYFLALLTASSHLRSETEYGVLARRVIVVDFDKFWQNAFTRLEDYVHGREPSPIARDPPALPRTGNISKYIRCVSTPVQLSDASSWFEEPLSETTNIGCPTITSSDAVLRILREYSAKILYVHVGFVSPESFIEALKLVDVPIIFEGQHTASVVASLGIPYLKLQDSVLDCRNQVLRIPDDMDRHCRTIGRINDASLELQRGALGEGVFEQSVNLLAALIEDFADPAGDLNVYLQDLQSHYRRRGADKFEKLLSAWNKFGCLDPPDKMKSGEIKASAQSFTRTLEEVELDTEMVKEMLSELGL